MTRFRDRRRQRAGLLLITAVGIVLGSLLPRIQAGATAPTARAGQVLAAVGFGILGLVAVIYPLLFLVVQSSNTTFTPRLNLFQTMHSPAGRTMLPRPHPGPGPSWDSWSHGQWLPSRPDPPGRGREPVRRVRGWPPGAARDVRAGWCARVAGRGAR